MGWSCRADAMNTLRAIDAGLKACGASTDANSWWHNSRHYFYEISRREHADGAITGTVYVRVPGPPTAAPDAHYCQRAGNFRIDGDGTVVRFPHLPRSVSKAARTVAVAA